MLLRLAAIALSSIVMVSTAQAQMTDRQRYVQCRAEAIGADVSSDQYATYVERCMVGTTPASGQFAACQSRAHAAGTDGDAYGRNLDMCMNEPTSGAATTPAKTYVECHSEAKAKFLTGDALQKYLNDCVGR
jgi:hypothetical protein